jgi:hypothetical protein
VIILQNEILQAVIDFYVRSSDFNGIPLNGLVRGRKGNEHEIIEDVQNLIKDKKISLCYETNPHIKSFPDDDVGTQLRMLDEKGPEGICVYPTEDVLWGRIDTSKVEDKPFTKMLAMGKPQLVPLFFDMFVLENYFSDPRYHIYHYDYGGNISYTEQLEIRDQAIIQSFGLGYKPEGERVVAVYLRYLSDLTPEHQQRWMTHIVNESCKIAFAYYQNTILGDWADEVSIYDALLEELFHINKMTLQTCGKGLFRLDYKDNRPEDFRTIFRPTSENFNKFVHCLDKIMSENISKEFFADLEMKDSRGRDKGTITLLEEWFRKHFRAPEEAFYNEMVTPFRAVRKMRQKPAHAVNKNNYNKAYYKEQNELIRICFIGIRHIRLAFANHPSLRNYKDIPDWLFNGHIRTY